MCCMWYKRFLVVRSVKNVFYCSKEHQKLHWDRGPKGLCGKTDSSGGPIETQETMKLNLCKFRYPEFEIIFEPEPKDTRFWCTT
eukprot:UN34747